MWERYNHRKMYTKNGHSVGAVKKELYICNSVISGSVVTRVYCNNDPNCNSLTILVDEMLVVS